MSMILSSIVLLAASAEAATIAELIAQRRSTMSRADAAIASNPEWSQPGAHSLFVPTDAALQGSNLPSGSLGSILVPQSIAFKTAANYQILKDTKSENIMVYDNYLGGQDIPEIHCRYGTGEVLAVEQIPADNGWLYILNGPIYPPGPSDVAIKSIGDRSGRGASLFLALARNNGLIDYINSLKDVTMWIPDDAALRSFDASRYTTEQLKSIIMYHITGSVRYSTGFNAGSISSLLPGQNIAITIGRAPEGHDSLHLNGDGSVVAADTFSTAGVIHLINKVLVPTQFPAVVIPTTTGSTGSTTSSSSAKPPTSTSTDQRSTNSAKKIGSSLLGGLLGLLLL